MGIGICRWSAESFCRDFFRVGFKTEVACLEIFVGTEWQVLDHKKDFTVEFAGWDWLNKNMLFHVTHPDIPDHKSIEAVSEVRVIFQRLL